MKTAEARAYETAVRMLQLEASGFFLDGHDAQAVGVRQACRALEERAAAEARTAQELARQLHEKPEAARSPSPKAPAPTLPDPAALADIQPRPGESLLDAAQREHKEGQADETPPAQPDELPQPEPQPGERLIYQSPDGETMVRRGPNPYRGPAPDDEPDISSFPKSPYLCSVCRLPQYRTTSGLVCVNGHGGASSEPAPWLAALLAEREKAAAALHELLGAQPEGGSPEAMALADRIGAIDRATFALDVLFEAATPDDAAALKELTTPIQAEYPSPLIDATPEEKGDVS
jgi:hypothetical protein